MKRLAILTSVIFAIVLLFAVYDRLHIIFVFAAGLVLIGIGIYDFYQTRHTIRRNFPLIGHARYILEFIRPEIQQYFIANNQSETPFDRETRSLVYQRAKNVRDTLPFGTQRRIRRPGYDSIRHSLSPTVLPKEESRVWFGGDDCKKPYLASRLYVSAMSFGALSKNAVLALNKGAHAGGFAHNTGEGGLSPYHLEGGGDLVWQLGTANFGCRTKDGRFDPELFRDKANHDNVKMIEIKLSQGAKPSHGGLLPAAKITPEIAEIRHIEMGKDCLSPPTNPEFSTPIELLEFVARLRELSGGKPVGFKLCIGIRSEFLGICKAMQKTSILPDFITVDGAEGGTGAAPIEFTDYLGEPLNDGLTFVRNALVGLNLKDKIRIVASGKVASGFDMVSKMALGADACNAARAMLFAIGCIQSLQCNANTCPTGVTTQNPRLMRGLVVDDKYIRVANFHHAMIESWLELLGAMGVKDISCLNPDYISHRISFGKSVPYSDFYQYLEPGVLLQEDSIPELFAPHWKAAKAERF